MPGMTAPGQTNGSGGTGDRGDEFSTPEAAQAALERRQNGAPNAKIPHGHYDTLALMIVNQVPADRIADSLGVTKATIHRYMAGKVESFNPVLEEYRNRVVRVTVHHQIRMLDMVEQAYAAIKDSLDPSSDPKLRQDTAFKLIDRAHLTGERSEVNVNLQQNNIQVRQEVRQTFANVMEKFTEVFDQAMQQDPNRHIRDGEEALPRAVGASLTQSQDSDPTDPEPLDASDS